MLRRRRPNGNATSRGAHPSRALEDRGGIGGRHRNRRPRAALAELRAGPGADHSRRAIGRRVDRFRRGLGARRPSLAHAGRGRDHRQLPRHQERGVHRRAAGSRFHRQGADRGPAAGPGHLLSLELPGSVLGGVRRAAGRAFPHAVERPALGLLPVVGRHHGPRLGHRSGTRRHAQLRHHAQQSARLLHPLRRQYLCRLPHRRGEEIARRRHLAQHRHRREIETGRNARRLSRQLQIQSARRQSARVQCRGAELCAVGQPRSDGDVVAGRAAAAKAARREEYARLCRARPPRLSRIPARCARPWPSPAASIARSATARCSTCSCSTCAAIAAPMDRIPTPFCGPTIICSGRNKSPGSSASWRARRRPGK